MTVCIAAICNVFEDHPPCVVCASDRMLTAGDIEFEGQRPKLYQISNNIAIFIAGDANAQAEICRNVQKRFPQTVKDTVEAYCQYQGQYNRKQAERSILLSFGMSMSQFLQREGHLSPDFSSRLIDSISRQRAEIETLICGVDGDGAHIYTVDAYGRTSYHNSTGFAAIGDGQVHASSQFMFQRYATWWTFAQSLLLTYTAKKRAEAAPGVGEETDLYYLWPTLQPIVDKDIRNALHEVYERIRNYQDKAIQAGNQEMEEALHNILTQYKTGEPAKSKQGSPKRTRKKKLPEPPAT